jgi:ATP-dependent DNA helicase RecQ
MEFDQQRALVLLRAGTGNPDADFRDDQEQAIRHVIEERGRLLVVQKTGWGKSFVYFIACRLLREGGSGPAIVISPLLALMRNQIAAAERMGVRAVTIHSDNAAQWTGVEQRILADDVDVVIISPERLANGRFTREVLARIADRIALLVIDEAHCISDWGHDFRPHYRLIERIVRTLPPNLRLLGTTATANQRVMDDLKEVLGPQLQVMRGDLNRPSLRLQTIRLSRQQERLAWLEEQLPRLGGSGIVYTLTVRDALQVTAWLKSCGLAVEAYTGESGERRPALEQALLGNELKALVATSALGMGFDKPDLGFVIHYQAPGSVVAYYQQVGRAGRAIGAAHGVLLSGEEETEINEYFIRSAFPSRNEVKLVLGALEAAANGLTLSELKTQVNVSQGRIQKTLDLLSLESPAPLVKDESKWRLTVAQLSESFWTRVERLTTLRQAELVQMQEYARLDSGHMEYLIRALDGDTSSVNPPRLDPLPAGIDPKNAAAAVEFLRRTGRPIGERRQWPAGGMPRSGVRGVIPIEQRAQTGRALCIWGDAGWGIAVRDGKYRDRHFSDELVSACANLVRDWVPEPSPTWVTCIPSHRHPKLVPSFAKRLAAALGLTFAPVLVEALERPEQKSMNNSTQQARNVDGSMTIGAEVLPTGPVLLVDDMVDSGWTLTFAAWLLRTRGSGEVFPLVLAIAGNDE